ncbi:uncharacterized protein BX663DRAFT_492989, partial [Cokeromyces recurvatus]|uniref:uncharacterized protein n=1 Tax=Cokeromyces recurvatus TaxID=90255 RepID=UPI00221FA630
MTVLATWASMPPYCRYCHSQEHALIDCDLRKTATICHFCNAPGHIAKNCPRRSEVKKSNLAKKARKVSKVTSLVDRPPVIVTNPVPSSADVIASALVSSPDHTVI